MSDVLLHESSGPSAILVVKSTVGGGNRCAARDMDIVQLSAGAAACVSIMRLRNCGRCSRCGIPVPAETESQKADYRLRR